MIIDLAREVQEAADRQAQLKNAVANAAEVQTNLELLDKIEAILMPWSQIIGVIAERIEPARYEAIMRHGKAVQRKLTASRDEFANGMLKQSPRLGTLHKEVKQLQDDTREAWHVAADAVIAPRRDLARLALPLPNNQSNHAAIRAALDAAVTLARDLPTATSQIRHFDGHLRTLDRLLNDLQGLPAPIRRFLVRLDDDQATLADLTPEVYDWCLREGMADKLRISRA